jgi:16S rRNA (adenine1518-N6/adenine1519-N6)-dimethyltransferase
MSVRPKHLGQHFLHSETIARRIAEIFSSDNAGAILEIGPGKGILTAHLNQLYTKVRAVEIDAESVGYLLKQKILPQNNIIEGDFLRLPPEDMISEPTAIIGNFPYNISSQIIFRIVEYRHLFPLAGGMFQREVAERIAAQPGSKVYGILSVWVQAFYEVEYCFTVNEGAFYPPPKVKSGVIVMRRRDVPRIKNDPAAFLTLIKTAFGQRQKMLRSSLKKYAFTPVQRELPIFGRRPEQLSVEEFDELLSLTHEQ